MTEYKLVAIDTSKAVFRLHCIPEADQPVLRLNLTRSRLIVARQSETDVRDNQAHAAAMPGINLGLHLFAIVSFERMPVKPGLSGHRLRRLRA